MSPRTFQHNVLIYLIDNACGAASSSRGRRCPLVASCLENRFISNRKVTTHKSMDVRILFVVCKAPTTQSQPRQIAAANGASRFCTVCSYQKGIWSVLVRTITNKTCQATATVISAFVWTPNSVCVCACVSWRVRMTFVFRPRAK